MRWTMYGEQELFAYGFRIGARVMLEVLQSKTNDLRE